MEEVGHDSCGETQSVSLDLSYHKEHEYIWFRGGDLNGFVRYYTINEVEGVGHAHGGFPVSFIGCILS